LARPEANVLWVCQYYLHHTEENCSIWNELIASQEIIYIYISCDVINEFQIEQFECGWVNNIDTPTTHEI
jgi:hypothetical protein